MKKIIFSLAMLSLSFVLFSFSTKENKKANFNELKKSSFVNATSYKTFTRYESHHYSDDQGTWSRRVSVWSLTSENVSLDQLEKVINN